jgi:hypothetical protein
VSEELRLPAAHLLRWARFPGRVRDLARDKRLRIQQLQQAAAAIGCTRSESRVLWDLVAEGWCVVRRGWPDFIAAKDGVVRLIEVKAGSDQLTEEQARVHQLLRQLGIHVEVIRV